MEALRAPDMKQAIETCFAERGFFTLIRSPLMQSEARLQLEQEAAIALALIEQVPASEGDELDDDLAIEDILAFALETEIGDEPVDDVSLSEIDENDD